MVEANARILYRRFLEYKSHQWVSNKAEPYGIQIRGADMNEGSMMIRMLMGMFYPNSISSWGEDINLVIFVGYLPPQPTEYYSACLQHAPVYYYTPYGSLL